MGFVGTKPTVSSNVVIADAGTIGSASDEDAIAIAADGSVTFTQDIELGHASDTTIARASSGQITVEGVAVLLAGAQTGITTILNAGTKIGRDADNLIDFATTDNKLIFRVEGVNEVELVQNALSPVTSDGVALGTGSLMWSDLFLASASVINFNNGDVSVTHTANLLTITGGGLVVGVDDTGHDVKFFGASAGSYMEWDESADQLRIMGASADATTSTGKLLLATSLTDINANDVLGKVEFQAPHEAGGTDAITVAAAIEAVAQGTFSASVNATDILFKTGHSEAATEKFRFTSQGEIGIGGTNYGTDGQVLTSGGAGAATAWEDIAAGGGTFDAVADGSISAGDPVAITSEGKVKGITALQTNTGVTTASSINSTGQSWGFQAIADPDENEILCVYTDGGNSSYGTALVVDVASDNTFTEGSEVVYNSENTTYNALVYDTNVDRFAVFYKDSSNNLKAKVATVDNSDSSVAFGSEASVSSDTTDSNAAVFDPDTNRVIFVFGSSTDTAVYAHVCTITGGGTNTIAIGSECTLSTDDVGWTGNGYGISVTYDTAADRVLVVWPDDGDSDKLTSVVGTVTGGGTNTIAFGTEVHVTDTNTNASTNLFPVMTFDPVSGKHLFMMYNHTVTNGEAYVGTVTGGGTNTCAWGSATKMNTDGFYDKALFTAADGNIIFISENYSNSNKTEIGVGTIVGNDFAIKKRADFYSGYNDDVAIAQGGTGNKIVGFLTVSSALYAGVPDLPGNVGNFVGFANSAISDTATGTINTVGTVATNQSSLTVGAEYYLKADGTLSAASTDYARIGKALTSTTLLIGGISP